MDPAQLDQPLANFAAGEPLKFEIVSSGQEQNSYRNHQLDAEIKTKIDGWPNLTNKQRKSLSACLVRHLEPVVPQSFWNIREKILEDSLSVENGIQQIIGLLSLPLFVEQDEPREAVKSQWEAVKDQLSRLTPDQQIIAITAPLGPEQKTLLAFAVFKGQLPGPARAMVYDLLDLLPRNQKMILIKEPLGPEGQTLLAFTAFCDYLGTLKDLLSLLPEDERMSAIMAPLSPNGETIASRRFGNMNAFIGLVDLLPIDQKISAIRMFLNAQKTTFSDSQNFDPWTAVKDVLALLTPEQKVAEITKPWGAEGETLLSFAARTENWEVVEDLLCLSPGDEKMIAATRPLLPGIAARIKKLFDENYLACYELINSLRKNSNVLQDHLDSGQSLGSLIGSNMLSDLLTEMDTYNLNFFQTFGETKQAKHDYFDTFIYLIRSSGLPAQQQRTLALKCAESRSLNYHKPLQTLPNAGFFATPKPNKPNLWQEKLLDMGFMRNDEEKQEEAPEPG